MSGINNRKLLTNKIEKIAKNKRKQQAECEENPQPLLTTEDSVKKESKKRFRISEGDAVVNDQMDWTYSVQVIAAENQTINQQKIDREKKTIMDDLLILFDNIFKYNKNYKANLEKLFTIILEKTRILSEKIIFLQSLHDNILYRKILGFIYYNGLNTKKDYDQALKCYQQLAFQGDA
ncbi:12909_t:CDS:1, partial [Ambispora gerdemannii]